MRLMRFLLSSPFFCLFIVVTILYGIAFNFYVPPNNGDDITYFHGALSILAGQGFTEQGKWIVDWPPIQSCLVAIVMGLTGIREYYIAKIVNGIAVFVSLFLAHRVMVSENRSQPTLSCILIAIFPTSLLVGSAGQADFTYFAFSMIFILLIAKMRTDRRAIIAILSGIVLGIAAMTRWQGVLLGTCLVFQAFELGLASSRRNVTNLLRTVWLELLASAIGALFFISWKWWIAVCVAKGTGSIGNYEYLGSSIWNFPNPIELFTEILNLLTQLENVVLTLSPALAIPLMGLGTIFLTICLWGGFLRIKEFGWRATDVLFLSTVGLLSVYAYKESRYVIPIAPFLLDYLFRGLCDVQSRLMTFVHGSEKSLRIQRVLFVSVWIAGLLSFDSLLLFYGDGESMGPASQLLLSDNRDYLRGYHRDLYDVCKRLSKEYPDAVVASDKFHKQLIRHYSGLKTYFVDYAPDLKYNVFVQVDPACLPKRADDLTKHELEFPKVLDGRLTNPRVNGCVTLWDVDAELP